MSDSPNDNGKPTVGDERDRHVDLETPFTPEMEERESALLKHLYYSGDASPDGHFFYVVNSELRYVMVSKDYCQFYGMSEDDVLGRRLFELALDLGVYINRDEPALKHCLKGKCFSVIQWFDSPSGRKHYKTSFIPFDSLGERFISVSSIELKS